jgi:hypothetical protein
VTSPTEPIPGPIDDPPASADPPTPPTAADRIAATLAPFGASIAGALALLPDASLPVAAATDAYTRAVVRPVTIDDAERWLAESTAHVVVKLDGWGRLSQREPVEGGLSDRAALALRARALIHDHVAHVIEATRGRGDGDTLTGYAELLLRRYTEGLDELVAWLPGRLAGGDPSEPAPGDDFAQLLEGLPAARFPAPAFSRHTGF